jgi:class 3 adenylate cyclase
MKSLVQTTVSYLDNLFSVDRIHSAQDTYATIVAGYSCLSEPDWSESRVAGNNCRQVAILYADVADSSRSTTEDAATNCHRYFYGKKIIKACISAFQGELAYFTGDVVLAEFNNVDDAIECAANVQIAIRKGNARLKPDQQIRYRVGISLCDVDSGQADHFDRAVQLAARLEGLARSGGICVSRAARESIRDKSRVRFVSLGKRYLHRQHGPVEALWIELNRSRVFDMDTIENDHSAALVS